jgi:MFS family permease
MLVAARQRRWGLLVIACALGSALGATLLAWLVANYGTQFFEILLPRLAHTQEWQSGIRWIDTFGFAALLAVAALPLSQTPVVRHEVAYRSCSHFNGGNHPCHRMNLGA